MAGSKVRASGSVPQRDAGAAARFLHKAGAEGVHGRGGIGSEKGLSGRGYVNGGRVASPRPLLRHLFEIYCTPTVARRRWLDARKGGGRKCSRDARPSFHDRQRMRCACACN